MTDKPQKSDRPFTRLQLLAERIKPLFPVIPAKPKQASLSQESVKFARGPGETHETDAAGVRLARDERPPIPAFSPRR